MGWQSIVAIVAIGLLIVGAVVKYIIDKKKGKKCAGGCAGCPVSDCASRPYLETKSTDESTSADSKTELKEKAEVKESAPIDTKNSKKG